MTVSRKNNLLPFAFLILLCLIAGHSWLELQNTPTSLLGSSDPDIDAEGVTPRVEIQWMYEDEHRLALELVVNDYTLPDGFSIACPVTHIEFEGIGDEIYPVYISADLTTLEDFYDVTQNSRWFCTKNARQNSNGSYKFSFMYFYNKPNQTMRKYSQVKIELGKVYATNDATQVILSSRGKYSFTLMPDSEKQKLTWVTPTRLTDDNVTVQIERTAVNPSFASLDACIEYHDRHYWRPRAGLIYDGQIIYSVEYMPTYPFPYDLDTTINSYRRCYAFTIPYIFPVKALKTLEIGVSDFDILLNDSNIMSMDECNDVKGKLSFLHPNIKIRCFSFELHNREQTWYEITEFPKLMPREKVYEILEKMFVHTKSGPWYINVTQ